MRNDDRIFVFWINYLKLKYYSPWHWINMFCCIWIKWQQMNSNIHKVPIQSSPQILTHPHKQNRQRCSGATLSHTLLCWNHLVSLKYWYGNQHWVIWQSDGETFTSLSHCLFARTNYCLQQLYIPDAVCENKTLFYQNCTMLDRLQLYSLSTQIYFQWK